MPQLTYIINIFSQEYKYFLKKKSIFQIKNQIKIQIKITLGYLFLEHLKQLFNKIQTYFLLLIVNSSMLGQDKIVVSKLKQIAVISLVFMAVEIVGGIFANSISILADAFHLLSDVLAYMISLFAVLMSYKASHKTLTFGYQKLQPLGALFNVAIIWIVTVQLFMQASSRMYHKSIVEEPKYMLATSIFGLCCNLYIMKILHGDQHGGHNCGHDHGAEKHDHSEHQHKHHDASHANGKCTKNHSTIEFKPAHDHEHEHSHEHNNQKEHNCKKDKEHNHDHHDHSHANKGSHNHGQKHQEHHNHDHHDHKPKTLDTSLNGQTIDHHQHNHEVINENLVSSECKVKVDDGFIVQPLKDNHHEHNHLCSHSKHNKHELVEQSTDLQHHSKQDSSDEEIHSNDNFQKNINIQAAYIHIITDIILSIGVIISAGLIFIFAPEGHVWSYWQLADPLCTYLFSFMAIYTTIPITKEAIHLLLNGCDNPALLKEIQKEIEDNKSISKMQSLKIWSGKRGKYYGALRVHVKYANHTSLKSIFSSRKIQGFVQLIQEQQVMQ